MDFPDFNDVDLDFSEFHPLDHLPWQCGGLPGGWRKHVALAWEFKWHPWLVAQTACRLGRHQMINWFAQDGTFANRSCEYCHRPAK